MRTPIPTDAVEVAFNPGNNRDSLVVIEVEKHTPTQVIVRGIRFRRDTGYEIGNHSRRRRIVPITPEVLDLIAASALQPEIAELNQQVRAAALKRLGIQL